MYNNTYDLGSELSKAKTMTSKKKVGMLPSNFVLKRTRSKSPPRSEDDEPTVGPADYDKVNLIGNETSTVYS